MVFKKGNQLYKLRKKQWNKGLHYHHSATFKKGNIPWNKGVKGLIKPNKGSFKKGEHKSLKTEFKKGHISWNNGLTFKDNNKILKLDNHPRWKGGRIKNGGYIYVKNKNHPYRNKGGYVLEHRLVMERYLGRFLQSNEVIHHKNKIKDDNRLENLELFNNNAEHISKELKGHPNWYFGKGVILE